MGINTLKLIKVLFFVAVKSLYRKYIEDLTKNSRIQKWMFATPEEEIDDPTGEIRRLKKQVQSDSYSHNSVPTSYLKVIFIVV